GARRRRRGPASPRSTGTRHMHRGAPRVRRDARRRASRRRSARGRREKRARSCDLRLWDTRPVSNLVAAFLHARGETVSERTRAALDRALAEAVNVATAAWPAVRADVGAWLRVVGELAPKPLDPSKPLGD